jgi:hypothetical protein
MKEYQDLSDIPPNPPSTAGRSQTLYGVEIIATQTSCARRHHSWARGIGSSARLESVAHVENTVMDVYYRNDSMKSAREGLLGFCWINLYRWFWYSQSRVKKKRRSEEEKVSYRRFLHVKLGTNLRRQRGSELTAWEGSRGQGG